MGKKLQGPLLAAALSALILAILLSACGSSSSETSSSPTAGSTKPTKGSGNPLSVNESGGRGASSFIKPNSPNNKYAKFGAEASPAELTEASKVLTENLVARESADFATQCASLSIQANKEISEVQNPSEARSLCAGALKKLATPLKKTEAFRVDNFSGQLASLRVKGKTGYGFYHGTDGKDWMMPMVREGTTWKASAIATTEV